MPDRPMRGGATVASKRSLLLLLVVLALAFQGSRGLWEPDEGFYGGAAAEMLDRGEWLVPTLEGRPFLDKPPLVYWGSVVGMRLLGRNEWGLRLPLALALVLAALAVGGIARTLWDEETGRLAALVYATSLGPFLAADVLTPDTPLAAAVAGFYLGYVRAEAAETARRRLAWWLLAGAAAGLGLLAKGPALLLWAAPVPAHLLLRRRLGAALRQPGPWLGALLALAIGAPWYVWIARTLPGAWSYILDNQVVGRLATATYRRNAGALGGLEVYLPTILALSIPWGPLALWRRFRRRRDGAVGPASGEDALRARWLLWLWVLLPLAVLLVARSRLPLYALPLSGALALAAARSLGRETALAPRLPGRLGRFALLAWCGALLALKGGAALWPADRDSRAFAREVAAAASAAGEERFDVVAVDAERRAVAFYLPTEFEQVRGFHDEYPFYARLELQRDEIAEATASGDATVFIFQREQVDRGRAQLAAAGLVCADAASSSRRHAIVVCQGGQCARLSPASARAARRTASLRGRSGRSQSSSLMAAKPATPSAAKASSTHSSFSSRKGRTRSP